MSGGSTAALMALLRQNHIDEESNEVPPKKKIRREPKAPNFDNPTEIVTFLIGEEGEEEKFLVHKESQTQTFRMRDVPTKIFRMLLKWFYTQRIEKLDLADIDDSTRGELAEEHNLNLVHLWVIADELLIHRLQNMVITAIEDFRKSNSSLKTTKWFPFVYQNTLDNSPLRHLVVDTCLYEYNFQNDEGPHLVEQRPDDFPQQLLLDVFKETTKAVKVARVHNNWYNYPPPNPDARPWYICDRNWRDHMVEENPQ
ncbi:hypothetical protein ONS96_008185 [Cadophora gregata f. sp. sojae]|nr:hypothetical protein ONS96_008185 [Cadophora gregata f. sp. sojae]